MEKLNLHKLLVELLNGTITLENSWVVSKHKFVNNLPIRLIYSTPMYLPKRNKNIHRYKDQEVNVHSNIIHNNQNLETSAHQL